MKLEIISHKLKDGSSKRPILFVHGAWHGRGAGKSIFYPTLPKKAMLLVQ